MKRNHLSIVLSLFAVFGSGIAVGAFGYHLYAAKSVLATVKTPPKMDPAEWRRQYIEEISTRLQLDPTQLGHLNGILDETRSKFQDLKERQKRETEQIRAGQTEYIRAMLTPSQRPEYEKFREERERRKKEQMARENAGK